LTIERLFDKILGKAWTGSSPGNGDQQMHEGTTTTQLIQAMDAVHERASCAQRELLSLIALIDACEGWRDSGARDMPHWLSMRYGISQWKARRWIAAAHALTDLPLTADAFASGSLGLDKVVEVTRFATPETEADLIRWARGVSCGAIRRKGDLAVRAAVDELIDVERSRSLSWWYFDEGRRFGLEAEVPAAQGAVIAKALERLAAVVPLMPGEEEAYHADARRADALVALCSERVAADPDQDRASVVIHAQLDTLVTGVGAHEVEGAPPMHHETLKRVLCNARVQTVIEDRTGAVLGLGRLSREPAPWMLRQVRHRDQECRFPGCGARRFTQAHHIEWWRDGGRTDPQNLLLICSFHHKLVHEFGWRVRREHDGEPRWFRPDGVRYRAGPSRAAAA
jgi:Domain of unknown function (DUF222)/HNH endonuclease